MSQPNSYDDYIDAIVSERTAAELVKFHADALAFHAAEIWQWGDGYGGRVRLWLDEAFQRYDLQTTPPPSQSRRQKRPGITQRQRTAVYERDEYRCQNCGTHKSLSVDHIVPLAKGGAHDISNWQTLCTICNTKKGIK